MRQKEAHMEITQIVQLITAATALVAVVVGPIVSVYVVRRQIRASVVSTNRQQWINNLRDTVADFVAKQTMVRTLNSKSHADDSSISRIEETVRLAHRIELLINPKEADHAALVELIFQMANTMNQQNEKNKSFNAGDCTERIVKLTQAILKREWDRVKRGD
jgi:uncharacterized membrane protein